MVFAMPTLCNVQVYLQLLTFKFQYSIVTLRLRVATVKPWFPSRVGLATYDVAATLWSSVVTSMTLDIFLGALDTASTELLQEM